MGDVVEVPSGLARKLLAMRLHGDRGEVCEVVTDPKIASKAKPIYMCEAETWGDDGEDS
jgi:hypothetical protein